MQIGLVGAGNIARALARGWGEPVLCTDGDSGRAQELADEVGGEALASNVELARRADLVVLCHEPRQLDAVAGEIAGEVRAVASVLRGTPVPALRSAYGGAPTFSLIPNSAVEVRRGVVCYAPAEHVDRELEREVLALFGRLGTVVTVEERLLEAAAAVLSAGPAYQALLAEAQVDIAVRRGVPADSAGQLVVESMAGTARLVEARGYDTLGVRREVTSPGGSTARGLVTLERAGVRAAFHDAIDAVVGERVR